MGYNERMRYEMSLNDARKTTIVDELLAKRFTNDQAAGLLNLTVRQVQRLKAEAAANGVASILHGNRGRKPPNCLAPEFAAQIVATYRTELDGYNFCHATDILAEEKGILVSVRTLARYLKADGIRSPKAKRRPKRHRSRKARDCEGELVQMDASQFDWLGTGELIHLHGALDDATGRVLALHFEKEETFEGYSELMFQMNQDAHLPKEIYTDGRTIFAYDSKKKAKLSLAEELAGQTESCPNFARALRGFGILLIIAGSPQAKGGIERLWETLQDRLPKDLLRLGISTLQDANEFLRRKYVPYLNRKFAVPAANPQKAYLPKQPLAAMQVAFAFQVPRKLDTGCAFSFNGLMYRLPLVVHGTRTLAEPLDTLTVATSARIGMKVLYKGLVMDPEPLAGPRSRNNSRRPDPLVSASFPTPKKAESPAPSPWRQFTPGYYAPSRRDDIFPDRLSP